VVRSSAGGGATAAAGGAALVVLVTVVVATAGWWACTLLNDWRARGGAKVAGVFRVMPCVTPPFRHPLYVSRSDT